MLLFAVIDRQRVVYIYSQKMPAQAKAAKLAGYPPPRYIVRGELQELYYFDDPEKAHTSEDDCIKLLTVKLDNNDDRTRVAPSMIDELFRTPGDVVNCEAPTLGFGSIDNNLDRHPLHGLEVL